MSLISLRFPLSLGGGGKGKRQLLGARSFTMEENSTTNLTLNNTLYGSMDWEEYITSQCLSIPYTLIAFAGVCLGISLCGLAGNGVVMWFLGFHTKQSPFTVYILNLAVADFSLLAMAGFIFLLSITITLGLFSVPESFCHQLGLWRVTAGLKVTVPLAFTATVSSLTAPSAVTALFRFPVLLCALLWLLSFLLTVSLNFCPLALMALVLSCLSSVLTLTCSALALLARLLCCSWKQPPGKLWALLLLPVVSFPFSTADFGYWLLPRVFDFSVVALSTSVLCAKEFSPSVSVAFQRAFVVVSEPGNRDNTVEPSETHQSHHEIEL
uniref:G-protein coupled receptors family 1 profile domain-containing protein n=1 Tax=Taeniopygia guttata TaxID=59729 RepID=A0A674G7E3_TAEGU